MESRMPEESLTSLVSCPFQNHKNGILKGELSSSSSTESMCSNSEPPGPRGPPVFGQAFNLDITNMHLKFIEWQKAFGDMFMFKILGKHYLVVSDPDILRKLFITCEHANMLNDRPASFMGKYVIHRTKDILFRSLDEKQQYLKKATMEYVEETLMKENWFYDGAIEELQSIINDIQHIKDYDIDIIGIMDRFASRLIGLLSLGDRISEAGPEYECLVSFMEAANELGQVKNQTLLTKLPGLRKMPCHLKDVYDQMDKHRANVKKYFLTENKNDRGLVAMLKGLQTSCNSNVGEEGWITDDFVMGVTMDMTAAAIVPLQNTLSVLFLVLVHDVTVQEKIREEMVGIEGDVKIEDQARLPYTSAAMLELKRYHTPLPISARHCNRTGEVRFGEYTIPKDTEIFSNLFGIHHDERFWPDPWTYKPDRFLTDDHKLVPSDHPVMNNFITGGVGPRRCVGTKFSDNILFLVASNILKRYVVLPSRTDHLPACDPRKFIPGVVSRSPDFKCLFQDVK